MSASCGRCGHPATAHTGAPGQTVRTCARLTEKAPGELRPCGCRILDGACDFCGHPVASHLTGYTDMWRICAYQTGRDVGQPSPCGCLI